MMPDFENSSAPYIKYYKFPLEAFLFSMANYVFLFSAVDRWDSVRWEVNTDVMGPKRNYKVVTPTETDQ